jgi:hypothetical protein
MRAVGIRGLRSFDRWQIVVCPGDLKDDTKPRAV